MIFCLKRWSSSNLRGCQIQIFQKGRDVVDHNINILTSCKESRRAGALGCTAYSRAPLAFTFRGHAITCCSSLQLAHFFFAVLRYIQTIIYWPNYKNSSLVMSSLLLPLFLPSDPKAPSPIMCFSRLSKTKILQYFHLLRSWRNIFLNATDF